MLQRIREAEREMKYEEYAGREGDIVTGIIQQTDSRYTLLDLGRVEALLPAGRAGARTSAPSPAPGSRRTSSRSARPPRARRSSSPAPTPASSSGCSSSRCPRSPTASSRSRPAPASPGTARRSRSGRNDHNVDPVGACVGARGARVRMVVNELRGEKIDIVPFSDDLADFVAKALSPAKVKEVRIHEDTGTAEVIVPDYQLSLAIGKEGQNARLAARLTGWRVDIKSETQLAEEEAATPSDEWAEGEWVANAETGELVWQPAEGGDASSRRAVERAGCGRAGGDAEARRRGRGRVAEADGGRGRRAEAADGRAGGRGTPQVRSRGDGDDAAE